MKELYIPSTDEKNKLHVVIWEKSDHPYTGYRS